MTIMLTVAAIPFWRQLFLVEECRAAVERALDVRFASHRSERDDLILRMTLGRVLFHTHGSRPEGKAIWEEALKLAENANDEEQPDPVSDLALELSGMVLRVSCGDRGRRENSSARQCEG